MTAIDPIEQRLRRTFRAVADQPVPPLGNPEPWRGHAAGPPRRHRRTMGGLVIVTVVALVVLGVIYGPRSSRVPPTSRPGLGGGPSALGAVFAPSRPASRAMLDETAATMAVRLHAMGDSDARATVHTGTITISSSKLSPAQLELIGSMGSFTIRPVLCGAPAQTVAAPPAPPSSPQCEAQYATTAANLSVNSTTGIPTNNIGPDPVFAPIPSTSAQAEESANSVLLPADPVAGAQQYPRFVLGASQFSNSEIVGARARHDPAISEWIIDITLTRDGATTWDAVALLNFHAYVAFELDGQVLEAPLIEPSEPAFSSFRGQMELSGAFSATNAKNIAAVLDSGPLPVPVTLLSQKTTP